MGENSIIIPESREIDRESDLFAIRRSSVDIEASGITRSYADDVRRRTIDSCYLTEWSLSSSSSSASSSSVSSTTRTPKDKGRKIEKGLRSRRRCSLENKYFGWLEVLRLFRRGFLFVLSLLGIPISSTLTSSSRGTSLVFSSSLALVSLLVVVLLRPAMAVPATNNAVNGNERDGDATLARIIQLQQQRRTMVTVVGKTEKEEETEEDYANFESVDVTTIQRRDVKEEEGDEEDEEVEHDDDYNVYDDADDLLHPRESGLESRSRLREAELDTIRRSIVEGLGLERIPDPSKANVSQTEYRRAHEDYLTRLQRSSSSKDGRLRRLHTFHPTERLSSRLLSRNRRSFNESNRNHLEDSSEPAATSALYFTIKIPDEDIFVDHATLRLLVDPTGTPALTESHDICMYRLTEDSRSFVSRASIRTNKGARWIELDATNLASLWHEDSATNHGLEVRFESAKTGRALGNNEKHPIIANPALNIFTTASIFDEDSIDGVRRKRRATPERLMSLHKGRRTECRGENKKCCRHEMTVIFKDLKGFEFIVQPKNFDAGYCKGRCPPRYNPAHHHALLQSLIWKEDKRKAPRPCCAPSKLDELEILYFDENDPTKLKVSSWKNMKVLECACS